MRKLRDRMHEDLTLRGLSAKTIDSYLRCVRKFAEHFGRSPSTLGAEEIRDFLLHLRERRVSASTFNVYAGAIKFLYRVTLERPEQVARIPRMRVPMHLPTVLSGSEMSPLIAALETDKHRALVMLAYGAGLRASEACQLCIEDVDPKRMLLHIRDTKRGRERYVMLSPRLLATLERAHARGHINLGDIDLRALRKKSWVVYAKRPFGGPEQVIRYLGRYTHRVGISNQRLLGMDDRGVTFRTKDGKSVTLPGEQMLARFVQHVLPPHFVKIRHYGLHAASNATTRLEIARLRLTPTSVASPTQPPQPPQSPREEGLDWRDLLLRLAGIDSRLCPVCQKPAVIRIALSDARCRAPPEAA